MKWEENSYLPKLPWSKERYFSMIWDGYTNGESNQCPRFPPSHLPKLMIRQIVFQKVRKDRCSSNNCHSLWSSDSDLLILIFNDFSILIFYFNFFSFENQFQFLYDKMIYKRKTERWAGVDSGEIFSWIRWTFAINEDTWNFQSFEAGV